MVERLTPSEATLLALDTAANPSHAGTLVICAGDPDAFVDERVLALVSERIAYVPRYRQRVSQPVGGLAGAFWVDDDDFDLDYHVQRLTLPAPGGMAELHELVAGLLSRRLDHARPLWEAYVVEGLPDGRFALLTKTHLSLVDGESNVDLAQVLLDDEPDPVPVESEAWQPAPEPSPADLLTGSLVRGVQDPEYAVDSLKVAVTGALGAAVALGESTGGLGAAVGELAEEALRGGACPPSSPLAGASAGDPQLSTAVIELGDLQTVSRRQQVSVHDVVLAAVTGALRSWLLERGASLVSGRVLTAVVPMAESDVEGVSAVGCQVGRRLQRLPVGEPSALVRLQLLGHGTRAWRAGGRAVGARLLSEIAGFAPATLHGLGRRAAGDDDRGRHDLVVADAPGPQAALFLAGAEVLASYPVMPLTAGRMLGVAVTSYGGQLFVSLSADRDGPDLTVLVRGLHAAVAELLAARARPARGRRP